jgi:hypothetical protein
MSDPAPEYLAGVPQLNDDALELLHQDADGRRRLSPDDERYLDSLVKRLAALIRHQRQLHERRSGVVIVPEPPSLLF